MLKSDDIPNAIRHSRHLPPFSTAVFRMKGFYCLTWRLTDAIDPKMSYIAKVPWYDAGKYPTSESVYREYAERKYGPAASEAMTKIINHAPGLSPPAASILSI